MPDLIPPWKGGREEKGRDFASLSGLSLAQSGLKTGGGISSGKRHTERVSECSQASQQGRMAPQASQTPQLLLFDSHSAPTPSKALSLST